MEEVKVRWGGKEVTVEMSRRSTWSTDLWGEFGVIMLRYTPTPPPSAWFAAVRLPPGPCFGEDADELCALGATAQEALDALAGQLREIVEWGASALNAPTRMSGRKTP